MYPWRPLFFGPSERFPIQSYRRLRCLRPWGQTPNDLVGPRTQVRLELVPIHVPKDGMERGGTGGGVGEAQSLRDPHTVIAAPFGNCAIAARATQHRTARQREDGGERMAFATRLPTVREHREHFNERTWLCYHQAPPLVRVVAHVEGCRASKAPPRTQPFIASGNLSCNTSTKTE